MTSVQVAHEFARVTVVDLRYIIWQQGVVSLMKLCMQHRSTENVSKGNMWEMLGSLNSMPKIQTSYTKTYWIV